MEEELEKKIKEFDKIYIDENYWKSDNEEYAYAPIEGMRQWIYDSFKSLLLLHNERMREEIERMKKELELKHQPLQEEYHREYKFWFKGMKTAQREKLLKEYENGAKGNRMFSLQEKIEVLSDVLSLLTKEVK